MLTTSYVVMLVPGMPVLEISCAPLEENLKVKVDIV